MLLYRDRLEKLPWSICFIIVGQAFVISAEVNWGS